MSSRRPRDRGSADIAPAIAVLMRDEGCDVDTAARELKDRAASKGVSIAEMAASIVAAGAAVPPDDDAPGGAPHG